MTVDWTKTALSDLVGIHDQIVIDSPYYASMVVERFTGRCVQIAEFPYSGQMVPEYQREDVREVIVYSYRMIYLVGESTTWILTIVHGAKLLPTLPSIL